MVEPRLFHLLHLSHRAVFRAADRTLAKQFDITSAQQAVLMYLAENEGCRMSALAEAVGLKAAATSGLVDRMEKKALLERRAARHDGRSFELFLKPVGSQVVKDSKALIIASNEKLLDGFSLVERTKVAEFLETIAERANALVVEQSENEG